MLANIFRDIRFRCLMICFVAILCPAAAFAQEQTTGQGERDESWDVIYLGQSRAGYSRALTKPVTQDGRRLIRSETEMYLTIKRFGQMLKIKMLQTFLETPDGQFVSFETKTENPPNVSAKSSGVLEGETLVVTNEIAGRQTVTEVAWDPEAKSPIYQSRLLEKNPLKPGDKRSFKVFVPETLQFAEVAMEAQGYETVPLPRGKKKLLKIISTMTLTPRTKIKSTSFVDKKGNELHSTVPLFGALTLSMYRVPRNVAVKTLAGAELDMGISTLVKVKPIEKAHEATKIVYRIVMPGEDPAEFLVQGGTQFFKKAGPDAVQLIVTRADAGEKNKSRVKKLGKEYTGPTGFLQSDDKRVIEHAQKAVGNETDPWKKAVRLERYVQIHITEKNFSTAMASAADVARTMEGDCTEHAVLLAAMARTVGIPSRIAAGLVYAERFSSFGGHMWTEVHINGRWIPLDATLGRGGIGAGHIKLSETSMADESSTPVMSLIPLLTAISKIKIEVVSVHHD